MHLLADRVSGAVYEIFAEALFLDVPACRVVHFITMQNSSGGGRFDNEPGRTFSRVPDYFEDAMQSWGRIRPAETGPSYVVEHRVRLVQLRPHVDQHRIAGTNRPACRCV